MPIAYFHLIEFMESIGNTLNNFDFQTPAFTIGLAFLTILIPISIAISRERDFDILDRNVLLDYVIRAKYLLLILGAIFLPPSLWGLSPPWLKIVELILWAIGIYYMITILKRSYEWMKTDRFKSRFKYLKNLTSQVDIKESWRSLWESENVGILNEIEYFSLFSKKIDELMLENKIDIKTDLLLQLLNDFREYLENRSPIVLCIREEVFPKLLTWHFKIWKIEQDLLKRPEQDQYLGYWSSYYEILHVLDSIISGIEKTAVPFRHILKVFNYIDNHVISNKTENEYIVQLFSYVADFLLNKIEHFENKEEVWKSVPPSWRITASKLNSKDEGLIPRIISRQFARWAQTRINQLNAEYDETLDLVTRELFPEVDPIKWARILLFSLSGYPPDNRIPYIVERPRNFGIIGRLSSIIKEQEDRTFELAILLFPNDYSSGNLKKYVHELETLSYSAGSEHDLKRNGFVKIFKEMIKYHNSKQKKPLKEQ